MPVYMDRHYVEGATRHAVADAHQKDLALQDKYHVKFLTYWFDEIRCTAFCLIEAPNRGRRRSVVQQLRMTYGFLRDGDQSRRQRLG